MKVAYLNNTMKIIGILNIGTGSGKECLCDVHALLAGALLCRATAVAICHNHPSGNLMPSRQDDVLTRSVQDAASILKFNFLDHIIFQQTATTAIAMKVNFKNADEIY